MLTRCSFSLSLSVIRVDMAISTTRDVLDVDASALRARVAPDRGAYEDPLPEFVARRTAVCFSFLFAFPRTTATRDPEASARANGRCPPSVLRPRLGVSLQTSRDAPRARRLPRWARARERPRERPRDRSRYLTLRPKRSATFARRAALPSARSRPRRPRPRLTRHSPARGRRCSLAETRPLRRGAPR